MSNDVIRVILADDHAVVRAGLKAVLSSARDITVLTEATNGREAVALAERFNPDVVVMDLSMAELDGISATREIVAKGLATRVLVLTMHSEEEYLVQALEAGAGGYLVKSAADRELVDAVRAVARGDVYVQPSAGRVLARGLRRGTRRPTSVPGTRSSPSASATSSGSWPKGTAHRRSGSGSSSARRRWTPTSSGSTRSSALPTAPTTSASPSSSAYSRRMRCRRTRGYHRHGEEGGAPYAGHASRARCELSQKGACCVRPQRQSAMRVSRRMRAPSSLRTSTLPRT